MGDDRPHMNAKRRQNLERLNLIIQIITQHAEKIGQIWGVLEAQQKTDELLLKNFKRLDRRSKHTRMILFFISGIVLGRWLWLLL